MVKPPVLLGAHLSIAGGIQNAFYDGASLQCTAFQIFTHSNRQWATKPLAKEALPAVFAAEKETGISHVVVHGSYLINLASSSAETREKSKVTLRMELEHCLALGIQLLVIHPGSNPDVLEGTKLIQEGINEVFGDNATGPLILLETMAGQGTQLGITFEQLANIRAGIHHKGRIGFCVDTCHIWAAGYDFSDEKGYKAVWKQFDDCIGITHLKAIHLNDSKRELNARVDRHANIGEGTIGLEAFKLLMNDKRFAAVPKILETPGKELSDYARNMKTLEELLVL